MNIQLAAAWAEYEAANRRATIEYERTPSIVPEIVELLEQVGLGRTARRIDTTPAALWAWFPDLILRSGGGDRFYLVGLPA